jgi:uncharacterized alkaline shock family protein YloU
MTDVAADSQPATGAAEPSEPTTSTYTSSFAAATQSTVDSVKEQVSDAAERAGEALGRAGDAVQEATSNVVTRIRNNATLAASRGKTTIGNEVVEKIAGIAAREVPGVYDLGGDVARALSAVKEKLHLGDESAAQGVSVKLEGKVAEITVVIVLEFGFQVFSVTEAVREKVISSVENLLGLDVQAVDVVVDDVHVDEEDFPHENDAQRAAGYKPETKAIVVGQAPPTTES